MLRRLWSPFATPILLCLVHTALGAYTPQPRWGQATALLNHLLLVHGGKTDQYNSFSYTAAPTTNDLLVLDLSQSFDASSPPWQYISGSENASSPQGPQLAWHTLSAYNFSRLLLFGGDGGPNSPIVLPAQADSAEILLIAQSIYNLIWIEEELGWANQPSRRIHHSTASFGGRVFIIGGEKNDGSANGYSDHYVFDPSVPSFVQLPTSFGPPDIYGHATCLLSDGRLLVFGGYSPSVSQMIPFTTIWVLDTTKSTYNWSTLRVSGSSVPPSRRAFVCTRLGGDKILIHGGSDAQFQATYSDGWILDTKANPATWSNVPSLSQLGPRRDHFAVGVGSQVVFGFGYETNAGAPTSLSIYDPGTDSFNGSYTPQSDPSYTTLPLPGSSPGSPTRSGRPSASSTSRTNPNGGPSTTSGGGDSNSHGNDAKHRKRLIIALASVFGCLGLAAVTAIVIFIMRRRRSDRRFHALVNSDAEDHPPSGKSNRRMVAVMSAVSIGAKRGSSSAEKFRTVEDTDDRVSMDHGVPTNAIPPKKRIDMLANEDSSLYADHGRRSARSNTGSSRSRYSIGGEEQYAAGAAMLDRLVAGSLSSMKSMGASIRQGVRRVTSEGSSRGHSKRVTGPSYPTDCSDEDGDRLLDTEDGTQYTYAFSTEDERSRPDHQTGDKSNVNTSAAQGEDGLENVAYTDPFDDENDIQLLSYRPIAMLGERMGNGRQGAASNLASITNLNDARNIAISDGNNSVSADNMLSTRTDTLSLLSSSNNRPRAPSLVESYLPSNNTTVRRSESWWSRFTRRPSFGEQRSDRARQPSRLDIDFRDPNPPPRFLSAIEEASGSSTKLSETANPSQSVTSALRANRNYAHLYSMEGHERSTSSFKTNKTADSAALERMAGRVDVVQREATTVSSEYSPSIVGSAGHGVPSPLSSTRRRWPSAERQDPQVDDSAPFGIMRSNAPVGQASRGFVEPRNLLRRGTGASENAVTPPPSEEGRLMTNIESRPKLDKPIEILSADDQVPHESERSWGVGELGRQNRPLPIPPDSKSKQQVNVKYGLVKRPQLYVANPDFRNSGSFS